MRPLSQITENEKSEIIKEYQKGILKCPQIGQMFNTGAWTIEKILKKTGVERVSGKLNKKQIADIVYEYQNTNVTLAYLGKKYGVKPENISSLLKRRGITVRQMTGLINRKFHFNENFFKVIDTEAKAYFLGLLYADGCNRLKEGKVTISLQCRDKNILRTFQKEISHKGKLKIRNLSVKNPNHQDSFRLLLCSHTLAKDLNNLGCVPAKSLILKFPTEDQIPNHLLQHFIRGYFDGDGSLYFKKTIKKHLLSCSITSSKDFLLGLLEVIRNRYQYKSVLYDSHKNGITYTLSITKQCILKKFLLWLYKDCKMAIRRKYKKAIKMIAYISSREI